MTPPGVPPGQPFQALQNQITTLGADLATLDARVDALEAAAPQPGLMWINPLAFVAVAGAPTIVSVAGPGLQVAGAIGDAVQVGLQVPLGFAVTGARVCYAPTSLTASTIGVQLLQDIDPPGASATALGSSASSTGTAMVCVNTTLTTSVDPSAGGAMFLGLTFTAPDTIVIRSVGLNLTP